MSTSSSSRSKLSAKKPRPGPSSGCAVSANKERRITSYFQSMSQQQPVVKQTGLGQEQANPSEPGEADDDDGAPSTQPLIESPDSDEPRNTSRARTLNSTLSTGTLGPGSSSRSDHDVSAYSEFTATRGSLTLQRESTDDLSGLYRLSHSENSDSTFIYIFLNLISGFNPTLTILDQVLIVTHKPTPCVASPTAWLDASFESDSPETTDFSTAVYQTFARQPVLPIVVRVPLDRQVCKQLTKNDTRWVYKDHTGDSGAIVKIKVGLVLRLKAVKALERLELEAF